MDFNSKSEDEIILMVMEGSTEASSYLVSKYEEQLLLYISNIIPNIEDAKDICQESFQKCFTNLARYNKHYAFSTWLYSIAQNCAFDFLRKKRVPSLSSLSQESPEERPSYEMVPSPEEIMIDNQAIERVINAIQRLPKIYRRVAELRFIHGYPLEEIAKELKLPLNTVKTRVSRAKNNLHDIWKS